MPMSLHSQPAAILNRSDAIGAAIAALPSPVHFLPGNTVFRPVNSDDDWAVGLGKRLIDLAVSVPALVLLSPLLLVVALLVVIDSRGPVFFRQQRTGACGKSFGILKFRTMHVLENGDAVRQACDNDPRTTRLGRFLRRYSIDELPQLINVVIGDMSLVGPRPHAKAHDVYYGAHLADYGHRFAVKPGMTGWAQINGHRGPTPTLDVMAARIACDIWYVKHAGFALDLKILLKTPLAIINPRNAV